MDAAESFWTFAGRTKDMLTGKADREGGAYRPDGMFFDEENNIDYNPITQQTTGVKWVVILLPLGPPAVGLGVAAVTAALPAIGVGAGVAIVLTAVGVGARGIKLAAIASKGAAF